MGGLSANKPQSAVQYVNAMPEAFVSSAAISREMSRRVKAGELRKLGSRLYTANLVDAPEAIVHRNRRRLRMPSLEAGIRTLTAGGRGSA